MSKFILTLSFIVCALHVNAQTYLQHLSETNKTSKGTIVIYQSSELDALVNGTLPEKANAKASDVAKEKPKGTVNTPVAKPKTSNDVQSEKKQDAVNTQPVVKTSKDNAGDEEHTTKVSKPAYKTDGYRVQVYAGGNRASDKQKAENIGYVIKNLFPDQAVYVHFYSPRWICRMGNFRTYNEAKEMLQRVKDAGYNQASLVKGKITVTD